MAGATVGTISHGTLRTADLIMAFWSELDQLDPAQAAEFKRRDPEIFAWAEADEPDEPDDAVYLLEDLHTSLSELAPTGCYFGAIDGDGSDFGFWFAGPSGDDYTLTGTKDCGHGSVIIAHGHTYLGMSQDVEHALSVVRSMMAEQQFWPDVWYVNERGNTDLIDVITGDILASYVWYVHTRASSVRPIPTVSGPTWRLYGGSIPPARMLDQ